MLRRYVKHVKVLGSVRSRIISALIYPAVLVLLSMSVVGLIVFKVVPQFKDFYSEVGHGAALPLSTRVVVALSTTLIDNAWLILGTLGAAVVLVTLALRQPAQQRRLYVLLLRLPYAGALARKFATAQVCRTLATLLSGGIPLVNALEIAAHATGNLAVSDQLVIVARQVREGGSLADALAQGGMFPNVAVEMVEVGNRPARWPTCSTTWQTSTMKRTKSSLERFSNLIQPLLLIVMGAILAGLIMSLYMPLFQLSSVMS